MKLFTDPRAPSPRRVHLLLRNRGIEIPIERIDLAAGEQLRPDFLSINPDGTVPVLQLDDGRCLTEVVAICRYLDETHEGDRLYGETALERARIQDADHWLEMHGLLAVMEGSRNAAPGMRDRGLPGPEPIAQLPELAERGRKRFARFRKALELRLQDRPWMAGDAFSGADITAWVIVEFAGWGLRITPDEAQTCIADWTSRTASRLGEDPAD